MTWQFAAILVLALVMTMFTSWVQTRGYTHEVNRMAREHTGPGYHLVTGRKNGKLGGAVVALVIDVPRQRVVAASKMTGRTAFARLRPAPELTGPLRTLAERSNTPAVAAAAQDALGRLPNGRH